MRFNNKLNLGPRYVFLLSDGKSSLTSYTQRRRTKAGEISVDSHGLDGRYTYWMIGFSADNSGLLTHEFAVPDA